MIAELQAFFAALRFFTRLPVPAWVGHSDQHLGRAVRYFPLVGILVGAVGGAVTAAAAQALPMSLAVLLGMGATLLTTGAFHEDGLADAADGFGGGHDRTRILEIMKDPRIGSFGAIAVGWMLLAKFNALLQIELRHGLRVLAFALISAHALSRFAASTLMCALAYVRSDGTSKSSALAHHPGAGAMAVGALFTLMPCLLLDVAPALVAAATGAAATLICGWYWHRRIGGYTGDCLGATQQFAELAFYAGVLCAWS